MVSTIGARDPDSQVLHKGAHRRILRIGDQHLRRRDDGLDVLQVDYDRALSPQDRRGVRQQGIEHAQVTRGEPRPLHDRVLADLLDVRFARRGDD